MIKVWNIQKVLTTQYFAHLIDFFTKRVSMYTYLMNKFVMSSTKFLDTIIVIIIIIIMIFVLWQQMKEIPLRYDHLYKMRKLLMKLQKKTKVCIFYISRI